MNPVKVTDRQLWEFLMFGCADMDYTEYRESVSDVSVGGLDATTFTALKKADINEIMVADMTEITDTNGDEVIIACQDVVKAIQDGYRVVTWYGGSNEALVVGVRDNEIIVLTDTVPEDDEGTG